MKNETDLVCSFIQDPERDFYIALHSDLNRIFRYDTDHIIEKGIERAEYELNCLLTYLVGRVLYFSNGYVLVNSGWRNRCAAGDEIGRVYFRSETKYDRSGGGRQDFKAAVAHRLRLWVKGELRKISGIWACGTDDDSYSDYKSLLEYAERVYRKVLESGKNLKQFLEELGREIEEWDGPSEPVDMYLDDIHKCRWIAAVSAEMSGEDPYYIWELNNGYLCEGLLDPEILEAIRKADAEEMERLGKMRRKSELIRPDEPPFMTGSLSPATSEEEEEEVTAPEEEKTVSAAVCSDKKELRVFGMKWLGTQADIYDFIAWASNNELIKETPAEIARNLLRHGGFGTIKEESLRIKISQIKKNQNENAGYSRHSYAKQVRINGNQSGEEPGTE